jgi:hypothetical protein
LCAVLRADLNQKERIMTDVANELVLTRLIDAPRIDDHSVDVCGGPPSLSVRR